MFKKLFALLLALSVLFSFAACSSSEVEDGLDLILDAYEQIEDLEVPELVPAEDTQLKEESPAQDATELVVEPTQSADPTEETEEITLGTTEATLDPDGWYYTAEDVSLYIYTYGSLPDNFITKNEARDLGWEGGSVERYAEGCAIGGDTFGNREGLLPKADGRVYYECDIDTLGSDSRGAKRLVFSNDGLIYYTEDHYESFILLYGEE